MDRDTDLHDVQRVYQHHLNTLKHMCTLLFVLVDVDQICEDENKKQHVKRKRRRDSELPFCKKRLWEL